MAVTNPRPVADLIHHLASEHASADTEDGELLRRFAATGDGNAFELLLWRHKRMVMGVCRRVLRDVHDAEDAFQATFLVLARNARSIAAQQALTTWLYTVAYRVALNALKQRTRRLARVGLLPDSMEADIIEAATPNEPGQAEMGGLLDEAVNSLPTKYRDAVVLCLLEGRSHAEAARVLRCASGTVASRLARAKARLRAWLGRRGVTGSEGALVAALGAAGAPSASARAAVSVLLQAAKAALAGGTWPTTVSPQVSALAQGVLTAMFRTSLLQILAVVLTAVAGGGAGMWLWVLDAPAAEVASAPQDLAPGQPPSPEKKTKPSDAYGDPLPAGAIAQLGSLRLYDDTLVQRVVLSPDGKWVVSWNNSAFNRLWDARSGKESPLADDLMGGWTPDGLSTTFFATTDRLVAVKKAKDRMVLWDVAAAREIARLPLVAGASWNLALSPDGKTLACSTYLVKPGAPGKLVFIDVARGTVRRSIALEAGKSVFRLTFSADGSTLAVHCTGNSVDYTGNSVDVWDVKTHTVRFSFAFKSNGHPLVGLSPDGRTLATVVHGEKQVRFWDVRAKKELEPLPFEPGWSRRFPDVGVYDVAFSQDGKFLAVTYQMETGVWDLAARKEVRRLKGNGPGLSYPVFSRDGKKLAAADGRAVDMWDLTTGKPCHDFGHGYAIDAVAFSPDGRTIVTGATYSDHDVRSWDAITGKIKGRWRGHKGGIEAIVYAPDGKLVASSSEDGTVRLWDAATGKEVGRLDARDGMVGAIAFSPDGKTLVAGGEHKVVHFWDVATRREVRALDNPGGRTLSLAFSPDGQTLATRALGDSLVRIWDVASGTQRRQFRDLAFGNPDTLVLGRSRLAFAPDNRTLAVNCEDGTVHLLDVTTGRESRVLGKVLWDRFAFPEGGGGGPAPFQPPNPCLGVAFAPDGRSLSAIYSDRSVHLWEVVSGRQRGRFPGHRGFAAALAYSPDGTLLVTGGSDRRALVWDLFDLHTADRKTCDFTRADADRLWTDLGDADAVKAFRAVKVLRANGMPAVRFLNERLRPAQVFDAKKIIRLIADLDRDDFATRESATKQLSESGDLADPALRAALNDKPSVEKRRRVEDLLKRLNASVSGELLRGVRAVEVLESLGTPEAREVLQTLAKGAAEGRLTREARAAVMRGKR
jgi:RNA polymerase sigma factor (sigma-70 family)